MAIETIDNFNIFVGRNIDSRYGPYADETDANNNIDPIFRYRGLTVLLTSSGAITEYWYYDGVTNSDLIPKGAVASLSGSNTQIVFFSGSTQISGSPNFTFNYATNYLYATGSIVLSGSTFIPGVTNSIQTNVVTIDPATGQLFYTASNALTGVSIPLEIKDEGNPVYSNPAVLNFTGSGVFATASGTTVDIYIPGNASPFPFTGSAEVTGSIILTGSMFVSGAISASLGPDIVGFYGTASWAQSASNALFAQTASFITASNVWGPFGSSSVASASFASSSVSASYAETASAAPSDTYIQYNKDGLLGATSSFRYIYTSNSLQHGYQTVASGRYSHAAGNGTEASGAYSYAGGGGTIALGNSQTVIGQYNVASTSQSAFIIGDGYFDGFSIIRHNVLFVSKSHFEVSASSVFLQGLPQDTSSFILVYNTASGQIYYTASNAIDIPPTFPFTGSAEITGSIVLTGSMFVSGAISASLGSNTVGFYGTASWATNALTASFITASNVWGPFGSSSVASASFASSSVSASYAETASAAPSDTYIQYNKDGLLGAEQYFKYIYTSHSLEQGNNVTASGQYSHAQGYKSEVYGIYSHAEGDNTYAGTNRAYSASFVNNTGSLLSSYGNKTSAFSVGEYILWYNGSFKGYTLIESKSYNGSITQVFVDSLSNNQYFILPVQPGIGAHSATGDQIIPVSGAHAEGYQSEALGDYSSAVGGGVAIGVGSQAMGGGLALGDNSQAVGDAYAIGIYSRAEGNNSKAIGNYSHAEGVQTQAISIGAHTEGRRTLAEGIYSHAEGHLTTASGDYSHAEGSGSIALGDYQLVIGQFNIANTSQSAFIIGDGTNNNNRHNVLFASASWFEVSASNTYLQGLPYLTSSFILTYDSSSGQVYFASSSTVGGGAAGNPAPPTNSIQFNNDGAFGGSSNFTFDNSSNIATLTGSLQVIYGSNNYYNLLVTESNGKSYVTIGDTQDLNNNTQIVLDDEVSTISARADAGIYLTGLSDNITDSYVITISGDGGKLGITASSAVGGSVAGNPAPPTNSIQFNNGGIFGGSEAFTFISASSAITLTGSLTTSGSTQNIGTALFTGSVLITGSANVNGTLFFGTGSAQALYTTAKITTVSGINTIYSLQTASYDGAFFDYTLISGTNARAGQIMSIWSGSEIRHTETTTTDIGSTSEFIFSVALTAGSASLQVTGSTGAVIKTIIKSI